MGGFYKGVEAAQEESGLSRLVFRDSLSIPWLDKQAHPGPSRGEDEHYKAK